MTVGDVVVAGIDVGNHTTEIVLARIAAGTVEPIAHGQAPTRGRKGSAESLEGAAALLHKVEVDAGVAADELLLSALRPVDTATAPLAPPSSPRSPVRSLRKPDASTPAGTGSGVGRHVPLADLTDDVIDGPAIVSVDWVTDFEVAAREIAAAVERGWHIVGVLAAQDDAVLIRNRIPIDVPVVDEVDLDGLEPGALVAVEVVAEGRAYRAMADPIALCVALELGPDADSARRRIHPRAGGFAGDRRHPPNRAARAACRRRRLRRLHRRRQRGAVLARPGPQRAAARATGQRRRRCAFAPSRRPSRGSPSTTPSSPTSSSIDNGAWLRRGVADTRGTVVALLAADLVADAAATLQEHDRTADAHDRHRAGGRAAVGAGTTPGLPPNTVVCDIGGGTIDLVGAGRAVTAAGAGEAITTAVARVLGIPRALAERVKRTPALRVEGPHVAHEEDGRRLFLDSPAPADAIGRLCTRGSAGLVPFSNKLAAEEWRSLRLAIKQETVAANIARCHVGLRRATAPHWSWPGAGRSTTNCSARSANPCARSRSRWDGPTSTACTARGSRWRPGSSTSTRGGRGVSASRQNRLGCEPQPDPRSGTTSSNRNESG